MQKIILGIVLFTFCYSASGQLSLSREQYESRRNTFKVIGWIILPVGLIAVIATAKDVQGFIIFGNEKRNYTAETINSIGLGMVLASIPCFIIAHGYKKKAASISFSTEKIKQDLATTGDRGRMFKMNIKIPL
jgi:hypothetical protein